MKIDEKLFFIGSGNIAQSIIGGLLEAKFVKAENIICDDIVKEKTLNFQQKFGISVADTKCNAAATADIIFFSVKPQDVVKVFGEIVNYIKKETIIISVVAGTTTKFIEDNIKKDVAVIRAMPNTPSLVRLGATALCKGRFASDEQLSKAKLLFSSVGKTEILPEESFDVITALSGSGPAYIFYFCELMQNAAEKLGLSKEIAKTFAVQTVYGAGKMLDVAKESAEVLQKNVKSPNGTTEAAVKYFESQNLSNIVYKAMENAMKRSKELSK
ncbi:MAG: pyrroline-5-carboxylate reductase [Endomicrobium sp.]|jgi:pyrroline-5-carboxylate reductase|nr:pyrroline-5-carboxylate reductase [Endomicrobium sp.]